MAISGLVVKLAENDSAGVALARLAADASLTLGERFGHRLAVVAETPDAGSDRDLFDELCAKPGIVHVDVTFVHLDEGTDAASELNKGRVEDQHAHR